MTNDSTKTRNENRYLNIIGKCEIEDTVTGEIIKGSAIGDLLNELNNENTHIKQTIQDRINTERTAIGQSVLRQLWEAIQ